MKIDMICSYCRPELQEQFIVELTPKNDCVHEIECPNGHRFTANILYHEFQQLFEVAINALADGYYREAIGSFAASYERLMELFVRIAIKSHRIRRETLNNGWKKIARQSERQLGAFIFLFIREFGEPPNVISENQVNLRNKVVHQGYFPTKSECIAYGTDVLRFIRETITLLHDSEKHHDELIRSINERGDFSSEGPKVTYYPYAMISTNRLPSNDRVSLEDMLETALATRKFSKT